MRRTEAEVVGEEGRGAALSPGLAGAGSNGDARDAVPVDPVRFADDDAHRSGRGSHRRADALRRSPSSRRDRSCRLLRARRSAGSRVVQPACAAQEPDRAGKAEEANGAGKRDTCIEAREPLQPSGAGLPDAESFDLGPDRQRCGNDEPCGGCPDREAVRRAEPLRHDRAPEDRKRARELRGRPRPPRPGAALSEPGARAPTKSPHRFVDAACAATARPSGARLRPTTRQRCVSRQNRPSDSFSGHCCWLRGGGQANTSDRSAMG